MLALPRHDALNDAITAGMLYLGPPRASRLNRTARAGDGWTERLRRRARIGVGGGRVELDHPSQRMCLPYLLRRAVQGPVVMALHQRHECGVRSANRSSSAGQGSPSPSR